MNVRSFKTGYRSGLSLIEIMMSVLVLSVGLLGVIAAIPFGIYQMNRMREADFTSMVARNAFSTIVANEWHFPSPRTWYTVHNRLIENDSANEGKPEMELPLLDGYDGKHLAWIKTGTGNQDVFMDLSLPVILDPHYYEIEGRVQPGPNRKYPTLPFAGHTTTWDNILFQERPVCPAKTNFDENYSPVTLPKSLIDIEAVINADKNMMNGTEYFFRTHDDLLYSRPEGKVADGYRPVILDEKQLWPTNILNESEETIPTYTGEYSWMAMIRPRLTPDAAERPKECQVWPSNKNQVLSVEADVIVFKGRVDSRPTRFTANPIGGRSRGGGLFRLGVLGNDDGNITDLLEDLKTTTHLLLWGMAAPSGNVNDFVPHARWYQIANFTPNYNGSGGLDSINVMLIGPDCPQDWDNINDNIKTLVFPNVSGVYTRSIPCN